MAFGTEVDLAPLMRKAIDTRLGVLDLVEVAGSGHYGPAFSCVEILVSLYYDHLRLRPDEPQWPDAGPLRHGQGPRVLGALPDPRRPRLLPDRVLATFCQLGSRLGDHPDMKKVPGRRLLLGLARPRPVDRYGDGGRRPASRGHDNRVVVLLGDGELNEGQVWEAAAYAAHRSSATCWPSSTSTRSRSTAPPRTCSTSSRSKTSGAAFGWHAERVDGHDLGALLRRLRGATTSGGPTPGAPPTA